jgi:hypothetical protein
MCWHIVWFWVEGAAVSVGTVVGLVFFFLLAAFILVRSIMIPAQQNQAQKMQCSQAIAQLWISSYL